MPRRRRVPRRSAVENALEALLLSLCLTASIYAVTWLNATPLSL